MAVPTKAELKDVWLRRGGFDESPEDRWLRHKIALLYDRADPDDEERHLLNMADLRSVLRDMPDDVYPDHESTLRDMARAFFLKRGVAFPH